MDTKITRVNEWLKSKDRKEELYKRNIELCRQYRDIDIELGKLGMILFFLRVHLGISYLVTLLYSVAKQRKFVRYLIHDLKTYGVEKKYEKLFNANIETLNRRINHIWMITKENIHLTKYEPFFMENGYDILVLDELPDISEVIKNLGTDWSPLAHLVEEIEKWNSKNNAKVEEHLKKIQPEIERSEAHAKRAAAIIKEEKRVIRDEAKKERQEIKRLKEQREKERKREKKINKELSIYWGD